MGERLPLTFPDFDAFKRFRSALQAVLSAMDISDAVVLQVGRAVTGWEVDPSRPPDPWTPDSPADFALFSSQALVLAQRAQLTVDRTLQYGGRYVAFDADAFSATRLGRMLKTLGEDWRKRLPGNPEFRFRLCLASEPFTEGPFMNAITVLSPSGLPPPHAPYAQLVPPPEPDRIAPVRDAIRRLEGAPALRFKRALVEHTIRLIAPRLPPEKDDNGERGGTRFAQKWLADPSDENRSAANAYCESDCMDGGVRYSDYSSDFHLPARVAATETAEEAASTYARFAGRLDPATDVVAFLRSLAR